MLLFPNTLSCSLYECNCVCAVTKIFTKFLPANNFCQLLRVTRKRSCTSAGNAQAQLHFWDDQQRAFGISNISHCFNQKFYFSLEEFHQHVVLAYAENFFVVSSYLWPPEFKSEWCKCVHVERFEIWVKNAIILSKNMFLACCEAFTHFSLSIRIDNNFLIIIAGDSTTFLLLSVYFKSKMWIFSIFG